MEGQSVTEQTGRVPATHGHEPGGDTPLPLGAIEQRDPGSGPGPAGRRGARKQSRHRVRSKYERAGRRAGVPVKPISLSVPASVAHRWRTVSQSRRRSLVDVMLDAITANKDSLADLVRTYQAAVRSAAAPVSDGLFLRAPSPEEAHANSESPAGADARATGTRPAPGSEADPYVTMSLRMLSTNVDTLDQLAYEAAADSRSQLVVAALTLWLDRLEAEAAQDAS